MRPSTSETLDWDLGIGVRDARRRTCPAAFTCYLKRLWHETMEHGTSRDHASHPISHKASDLDIAVSFDPELR